MTLFSVPFVTGNWKRRCIPGVVVYYDSSSDFMIMNCVMPCVPSRPSVSLTNIGTPNKWQLPAIPRAIVGHIKDTNDCTQWVWNAQWIWNESGSYSKAERILQRTNLGSALWIWSKKKIFYFVAITIKPWPALFVGCVPVRVHGM